MSGRRGPWSLDDRKFMEDNWDSMDYEDIAAKLRRDPKVVRRHIEKTYGRTNLSKKVKEQLLPEDFNIKKSPVWKELRAQFNSEELKKFLYYWGRIVGQFKEDVLATEEMQVVDYIRLELLIDRLLNQQHQSLLEISTLEQQLDEIRKSNNPDIDRITQLSDSIAIRRSAIGSMTKEYQTLYVEKTKTLDKMKGTRDARVKHLESSKDSFIGWVKQIVTNEVFRKEAGIYMEKLRLAMKKEEERLSKPHKYIDGMVDIPLLTTTTIDNE